MPFHLDLPALAPVQPGLVRRLIERAPENIHSHANAALVSLEGLCSRKDGRFRLTFPTRTFEILTEQPHLKSFSDFQKVEANSSSFALIFGDGSLLILQQSDEATISIVHDTFILCEQELSGNEQEKAGLLVETCSTDKSTELSYRYDTAAGYGVATLFGPFTFKGTGEDPTPSLRNRLARAFENEIAWIACTAQDYPDLNNDPLDPGALGTPWMDTRTLKHKDVQKFLGDIARGLRLANPALNLPKAITLSLQGRSIDRFGNPCGEAELEILPSSKSHKQLLQELRRALNHPKAAIPAGKQIFCSPARVGIDTRIRMRKAFITRRKLEVGIDLSVDSLTAHEKIELLQVRSELGLS